MSAPESRNRGVCTCGDHAWAVLTKGYVTLVSPEDAGLLQERNWYAQVASGPVYAGARGGNGTVRLHRTVLNPGDGVQIDHINHNGLDNRRCNLRVGTTRQNQGNSRWRVGPSGYRGVTPEKRTGRWQAQIARLKLGSFPTPEEAARSYDAAAIEWFGPFASLNFEGSE
jgi:hypothetical protein